MKPAPSGLRPEVLKRVALWSVFLGLALHLAAVALGLMDGPNPVRRGTLKVIGMLFFPAIGSFAVMVGVVAGVWSFALSSKTPPPAMVGRRWAPVGTPAPTGPRGVAVKSPSSKPQAAVPGRVGPWSAFLGVALLIAAVSLQGNPMQRGPLAVAAIPLLSFSGTLAMLVAALIRLRRHVLDSDIPRPILLGRVSLWSGVSAIVGSALPLAAMATLGRSFASQSLLYSPLLQGVFGAVGLANLIAVLVAVAAGIASLGMSRSTGTLNRSGLVGLLLGGLILAAPFLAMLAFAVAWSLGSGRF